MRDLLLLTLLILNNANDSALNHCSDLNHDRMKSKVDIKPANSLQHVTTEEKTIERKSDLNPYRRSLVVGGEHVLVKTSCLTAS